MYAEQLQMIELGELAEYLEGGCELRSRADALEQVEQVDAFTCAYRGKGVVCEALDGWYYLYSVYYLILWPTGIRLGMGGNGSHMMMAGNALRMMRGTRQRRQAEKTAILGDAIRDLFRTCPMALRWSARRIVEELAERGTTVSIQHVNTVRRAARIHAAQAGRE